MSNAVVVGVLVVILGVCVTIWLALNKKKR